MQYSLFDRRPPALSVSAITQHIQHLIDVDEILQNIWLEGEISNWSPASSGHIYFTLKDSKASIRAVIWRSVAARLAYRPQGDGEAVLAHGRVSVYAVGGTYQFYVDDLEPAGQGALYLDFERLKRQLAAEGLFETEHKQPLPFLPERIGIVTSPQAAALRDIINVLRRRYPVAEVIISPTPVQGEDAPPKIVAAIEQLLTLPAQPDVIILARGGGSIEDLWAFNNETVARMIAASPVPIVTGVGHETDFTIADFVADQRAPTPSAAAEMVTPDMAELQRGLLGTQTQLTTLIAKRLREARTDLQEGERWLKQFSPQYRVDNRRQELDDLVDDLERALHHRLIRQRDRLATAEARLSALNPEATLARGYAIIHKGKAIITSKDEVTPGDSITVTLKDGDFEAKITG